MTQITVTEEDLEALLHLSKYAETEVSSVQRRSINRFHQRIADAMGSIEDFKFLLTSDRVNGSGSRTIAVSKQLARRFRVTVDRIVEDDDIASTTSNVGSEKADPPEWLDRLHNRAHTWDPTHQADIDAGLACFE